MAYLGLDTLRWVKLLKHPLASQMKPDILWSIQKEHPVLVKLVMGLAISVNLGINFL